MFNFEAFHCGVKCSISTLLSNRFNLLNRWLLVEKSIRCLHLLETNHKKEIMYQQITNVSNGLTYMGKKVENLNTNSCS